MGSTPTIADHGQPRALHRTCSRHAHPHPEATGGCISFSQEQRCELCGMCHTRKANGRRGALQDCPLEGGRQQRELQGSPVLHILGEAGQRGEFFQTQQCFALEAQAEQLPCRSATIGSSEAQVQGHWLSNAHAQHAHSPPGKGVKNRHAALVDEHSDGALTDLDHAHL